MLYFQRLEIVGDELHVICTDEDNKELIALSVDMAQFYWEPGHLKDNVLINGEPNEEFLENFCCDVPTIVEDWLYENEVMVINGTDIMELFNNLLSEMFGI